MATASQTKIFNGDFNIKWSFNLYPDSAARRGRTSRAADAGAVADRVVYWLEKEDSPAVKAACYSFFSVAALYFGGHLVKALLS